MEKLTVKFCPAPGVRNQKFYLAPGMRNGKICLAPNYSFEKFYLAVKGLICPHIVMRFFRMSSLSSQISLIKLPRCGHCRTNSIPLPLILNIGLRQQLDLLSPLSRIYRHFDFLALNNTLNPLANLSLSSQICYTCRNFK